VTTGAPRVTYEWQRLTASIGDDWRVRDGNTLTWVPTRQRFVMVHPCPPKRSRASCISFEGLTLRARADPAMAPGTL